MAFCRYCGQQYADGTTHICPQMSGQQAGDAAPQRSMPNFDFGADTPMGGAERGSFRSKKSSAAPGDHFSYGAGANQDLYGGGQDPYADTYADPGQDPYSGQGADPYGADNAGGYSGQDNNPYTNPYPGNYPPNPDPDPYHPKNPYGTDPRFDEVSRKAGKATESVLNTFFGGLQIGKERVAEMSADSKTNNGGAYERNQMIVDQCIEATDEEIPVKQYNMAVLRTIFPYKRAEGRLQVTNKRIIFRATGNSWLGTHYYENEFALENVTGLEIKKDRRVNGWFIFFGALIYSVVGWILTFLTSGLAQNAPALLWIFGFLFLGAGAFCTVVLKNFHWVKMILFEIPAMNFLMYNLEYYARVPHGTSAYGYPSYGISKFWAFWTIIAMLAAFVAFVMYTIKEDLIIKIKVSGAQNAVEIRRRKKFLFWVKEEYTGFSEVLPWKETEQAVKELGALINDVKQYGNEGIEKWQKENAQG